MVRGISFDGMASGMETDKMIEQLMEIERVSVRRLEVQKEEAEVEQGLWQEINQRLQNFDSSLNALRDRSTFESRTVNSTNENLMTASAEQGARESNYQMRVTQLATAHRIGGAQIDEIAGEDADVTTSLELSGNFEINGQSIEINTEDSLRDIRDAINSAEADVEASIMDNRLILTSTETGKGNTISLADIKGNALEELGVLNDSSKIGFTEDIGSISSQDSIHDTGAFKALNDGESGTFEFNEMTVAITASDGGAGVGTIDGTTINLEIDSTGDADAQANQVIQALEAYQADGDTTELDGLGFGGDANGITITNPDSADLNNQEITVTGDVEIANTLLEDQVVQEGVDEQRGEFNFALTEPLSEGDVIEIGGVEIKAGSGEAIDTDSATTIEDQAAAIKLALDENDDFNTQYEITDNNDGSLTILEREGEATGESLKANMGMANQLVEAQNAKFEVDGLQVERANNTGINDVIEDVSLDLHGANQDEVFNLSVNNNTERTKEAITNFVNEYNSVQTYLHQLTKEDGMLQGDTTARRLSNNLRRQVTNRISVDEDYNQIAQLGIEIDPDADVGDRSPGNMQIDEAKLDKMLNQRPEIVQKMFRAREDSDGVDGIARRVRDRVQEYIRSGDGVLTRRDSSLDGRMDRIDRRIENQERRIERREKTMRRQFARMEVALNEIQAQQSWLAGQIEGLEGNRIRR